jgi:hypothetical protein
MVQQELATVKEELVEEQKGNRVVMARVPKMIGERKVEKSTAIAAV